MTDLDPLEQVSCECCGRTCPTEEAVEYWRWSPFWPDEPRVAVFYCRDCNVECHALGEDCKVLERLDHAEYAARRRPVTDDELSEVREMVERSVRQQSKHPSEL